MLENLKGINPAMAIASIITIQYFYSADISKENYCWLLLFILPWEKAYGVSAGAGEIHLVRSDSNGKMRTIETTLEHIAHESQMNTAWVWHKMDTRISSQWKWWNGSPSHQNSSENQFELMEKTILLLGRRFRFIYPTLSRCHVWARIRNRFASFTQSWLRFSRRYYYDWVSIFTT
jgi:hypothetical protein